ncbi:DUF4197 domain-containing protein [Desulfocurvus sp. DL9XJH121]
MKRFLKSLCAALPLLTLLSVWATPGLAGWADTLSKVKDAVKSSATATSASSGGSLTASEMVQGLKAALEQAVGEATSSLGVADGFLGNADVKIPVPDSLATVEKGLRLVGQSKLADSFVTSMNRAAERAVPETVDVLKKAVTGMTFDDAKGILNGGDTAATDFFRRTSDSALLQRLEPIVSEAMQGVGVTRHFQNMTGAAKAVNLSATDVDLDAYVTRKALDGLYLMMEREEADIRNNAAARGSAILKKVFGSL